MKILLSVLVFLSQSFVASSTIVKSTIDTTHIDSTILPFVIVDTLHLTEIVQPVKQNSKKIKNAVMPINDLSKLTELESRKIVDLLGGIGDFFIAIGQFYTFRSTFGYYKEKGQNGHGPYTLFDRTSTESINQQLTSYPPYFQVLPIRQIAHW
jgi:hypothetical protein